MDIAKAFGFTAAIVAYFIYKDYQTQKRSQKSKDELATRLNKVEDYQRDKLEGLVVSTNAALNNSTETTKEFIKVARTCAMRKDAR